MNDRKLINYLPPVLRTVFEFMQITDAQQPEFERAWEALNFVMDNQFIDTATEEGVAAWEKELNITPFNTDTLDQRKQRIKTAWTYGVVYTYYWLVNWIKNSCGENNPPPTIRDYVLHTALPITSDYKGILENLRRYISSNVLIDSFLILTEAKMTLYAGTALRSSIKQTLKMPVWDTSNIVLLTNEKGAVLTDENNNILFEEDNV